MSAVIEFYEWLDEHQSQPDVARRGRKPKDKRYFTEVTQNAIIAYNKETDQRLRDKIYREHIDFAFNKLVENIYHTFKFSYFDVPYEDIKCEVVAFLNEKIDKYKEGKGKAFSYFSIIAKNYLIIQNNANYKALKQRVETSLIDESRNLNNEVARTEARDTLSDFIDVWCDWYDVNLNRIFAKRNDIVIADAVLELFRIRKNIEDYNKKALYILLRERTGLKTQHITKIVNLMQRDFETMFHEYRDTGRFNTPYL
jgi:hypothetical protein